nr:hypothetical protein [Tanacetum cinerariifolium]
MLEKSLYDSWKSRMKLYIENWENGRMILNSVQNGPLVWPTVVEEGDTTRTKRYEELKVAGNSKLTVILKLQTSFFKFPQQTNTMITQVYSPQPYSPMYPPPHLSQPQISHSSVPPSQQYQSHMDHQTLSVPLIAYNSPKSSTQPMTEFCQMDLGLTSPVFNQGDDPIVCLNKAMAFLTAVASSRFPSTNNQLRTSSNLRNQAPIQNGMVTMQQVQRRQGQSYAGTSYKGNATSFEENNAGGQTRVVKCYNFQGEGHMIRQCTPPKRPRNAAWFKENAMLAEAEESSQILDEEQVAFLADPGIPDGQATQITIPNIDAFQTEDLDAYNFDCDDVSNAKAVLIANLFQLWFRRYLRGTSF